MFKSLTRTLVAALLVAATSGTQAIAANITVVSGVSPVFAPPFIADLNGYFEEEGLDVTVRTFQVGAAANEAFRSIGAQYLVTCDQPMLMQAAAGDAVIVTQFSEGNFTMILSKKDVESPADLKGKKIGLFRKSAAEYLVSEYMKSGGFSTEDVELVHLAPFDQVAALTRGDVDAISVWKPFDQKVFGLSDDFKVLVNTGDLGYSIYCGMVANRAYLESGDPEIEKFMRAIKKGADWLTNASPDEAGDAIAKYTKLGKDDVIHTVEGHQWDLVSDAAFREQLKNLEEFLMTLGMIKEPVNWDTVADWSHIQKLDPALYQE